MRSRTGFTLIELMVVVLIVAVLAAILIPLLNARLEAARWAEGKSGCGTIATAIRAMYAEQGEDFDATDMATTTYVTTQDMRGKYFSVGDYTISGLSIVTADDFPVHYTITVTPPASPQVTVQWTRTGYALTYTGDWLP